MDNLFKYTVFFFGDYPLYLVLCKAVAVVNIFPYFVNQICLQAWSNSLGSYKGGISVKTRLPIFIPAICTIWVKIIQ